MKSNAPLVWVTTVLAVTLTAGHLLKPIYAHHQPDHNDDLAAAAEEDPTSRIRAAMESAEIVPDVVGKAPTQLIKVSVLGE